MSITRNDRRQESGQSWQVRVSPRGGGECIITHGSGGHFPQCAALHLRDGYFRLAPGTGWGTSIVLPPSFWSRGKLIQGMPVAATWQEEGENLVITATGSRKGLSVALHVVLSPPSGGCIMARVQGHSEGDVPLDARRDEAFKIAMLSSMRVSPRLWDASALLINDARHSFDDTRRGSDWLLQPSFPTRRFGLAGGGSDWKKDAPGVLIEFDQPQAIAGWRAWSRNANCDNVALWAASDHVVREWSYVVVASSESNA